MQSYSTYHPSTPQPRRTYVRDPETGDLRGDVTLFSSDNLLIVDRLQSGARGSPTDWGPVRGGGVPAVLFLRAGLFECRTPRDYVLTETTHIKCYDAAHEYQMRRIHDDGEAYTIFRPSDCLMQEAFGRAGYQASCASEIHYRHLKLYRQLSEGSLDGLEAEEAAMSLLADASRAFGAAHGVRPAGPRLRRRLQEAQAFIAADPARDHRLAEAAAIAGCSEFHFARLFRAETGQSLRSYRKRLRLRLALRLISEGEGDLTTVAMESGFSTHSHMTATFQAEMGRTPSAARARIAPQALSRSAPI